MSKAVRIPKPKRKWSEDELRAWATAHSVGTPVRYWSVRGSDEFIDSVIRSDPWRLGHGDPIVKIEGVSGGVALDHLCRMQDS